MAGLTGPIENCMSANPAIAEAEQLAHRFLPAAGGLRVAPIPGGANNRVWKVEAPGGPYVLKQYYQPTAAARNRFASERAFYAHATSCAGGSVPKALAWNDTDQAALFEFVPGRKVLPSEVGTDQVSEALSFLQVLNHPPIVPPLPLPEAAEACFRVADHLAVVEQRLWRLQGLPKDSKDDLARAAGEFVAKELLPAWATVAKDVGAQVHELDAVAPARCASPSDFGFHNALLRDSGGLCFFDFEYAGWDDPAKTIGDFLCQPEIPVGPGHREAVIATVARMFPDDRLLSARARALLPVYQIKWCGIMLNDFTPADRLRRDFALSAAAAESRRLRQLERARAALAALTLP